MSDQIADPAKAAPPSDGATSTLSSHVHYKIFRDYVQHEDSLINNRALWNINIQGFLFGSYAFTVQKLAEIQAENGAFPFILPLLIIMIPCVGLAVSTTSWVGIRAAQRSIARLKSDWETEQAQHYQAESRKLPGLTGGGDERNHRHGFWAPSVFPLVFVAAWVILGAVSVGSWLRFGTQ
jgi:hypothetical protein